MALRFSQGSPWRQNSAELSGSVVWLGRVVCALVSSRHELFHRAPRGHRTQRQNLGTALWHFFLFVCLIKVQLIYHVNFSSSPLKSLSSECVSRVSKRLPSSHKGKKYTCNEFLLYPRHYAREIRCFILTTAPGIILPIVQVGKAFPNGSADKESACNVGDTGDVGLIWSEQATHSSILA